MVRSILAYVFAAALLVFSSSAFRQAFSESRDTEPGSLLFAALQLVIGTSGVVAAIGLVRRKRWAAWPVASWGAATAALLAVQPLFEPMDSGARWSIWSASAVVGVVAAGVSWFARRGATSDVSSRAAEVPAQVQQPASGLLRDGQRLAGPSTAVVPDAHVRAGVGAQPNESQE